jgi:hypothetical protein
MVLDYKVFEKLKNKKYQEEDKNNIGLLYVLEQVPNSMIKYDISEQFLQVNLILF